MRVLILVGSCLVLSCGAGTGNTGGGGSSGSGGGDGGNASPGDMATAGGGGAGGGGSGGAGGGGGSGGAGGGGDVPEYVSGTRIKARILTTPDGAKEFVGWQDTMLNVPCNFIPTPDGVRRCVPTVYAMATLQTGYFSDMGCTTANIAYTTIGCPTVAPSLAYTNGTQNSCDSTWGNYAYKLLTVTGPYTGTIWAKSGVTCAQVTTPPPNMQFWTVGNEVDYTTLAGGTISVQ